jgi:hypothetical protein
MIPLVSEYISSHFPALVSSHDPLPLNSFP